MINTKLDYAKQLIYRYLHTYHNIVIKKTIDHKVMIKSAPILFQYKRCQTSLVDKLKDIVYTGTEIGIFTLSGGQTDTD